jgi:hypothetical protein
VCRFLVRGANAGRWFDKVRDRLRWVARYHLGDLSHGCLRHSHSLRCGCDRKRDLQGRCWDQDGRIVSIGEALTDADEVVHAEGMLVLPGGIDSHVHISQPSGPGIVMADDFASATRAAAFGGNTL